MLTQTRIIAAMIRKGSNIGKPSVGKSPETKLSMLKVWLMLPEMLIMVPLMNCRRVSSVKVCWMVEAMENAHSFTESMLKLC